MQVRKARYFILLTIFLAIFSLLVILISGCQQGTQPTEETPAPKREETTTEEEAAPKAEKDKEAETIVTISGFTFQPSEVTIKKGDTVVWKQEDSPTHTVTSDDGKFDSGNISQGQTFKFTFKEAGAYFYHCEIHPAMTGTVMVE